MLSYADWDVLLPLFISAMTNHNLYAMPPVFYHSLYRWYEQNSRVLPWRETDDPYRVWISEIILQQTRVTQGMSYYLRFVERFPTVRSLAETEETEVLRYWQGLGYYSRARNLHRAARQIVAQYGNRMPDTFDQLRALPGVGDYTAGAIASFAYNLPHPAMDGNVYRVLARLYDSDEVFDTTAGKRHFHRLAEDMMDREQPRLFNSAMMELGALQCLPQHPDCAVCPVVDSCLARAHHTVDLLPVRKQRTPLQDRYLTYRIYLCGTQTIIYQRTRKDIWQHLWEFPVEESKELGSANQAPYCDWVHILSHQRLHTRFIVERVASLETLQKQLSASLPDVRIVSWAELDDYPLSRLTEKAVAHFATLIAQ